jgi:hypothetical protein
MNPILMSYISEYLVPRKLRLEFKDRLENLCSLSGTPMSPDLREWVIRTFGLEMVRVMESYSSLTPPVFSPALQRKINQIVPSNYQGEDVNLMFRQQFDTSCCDNMYIVSFTDTTYTSFSGWTLNGYPDYDWFNLAASFGGTYNLDFAGIAPIFSPPSQATFMYQGLTPPPDLIGTDAFANPVSYSFTKLCEKKVFQYEITNASPLSGVISSIQLGDINIDLSGYGGPVNFYIDVDNAMNVINSALNVYFGPTAFCVIGYVNFTGFSVGFTMDFHNIYANSASYDNGTPFTMYSASDFDFTNTTINCSDISYDSGTGLFTYGVQIFNWIMPALFTPRLRLSMDPSLGIHWKSSITPIVSDGFVTTNDPVSVYNFHNAGDTDFIGSYSGSAGLSYISFASRISPPPAFDTVTVRNPYDFFNPIGKFDNTIS